MTSAINGRIIYRQDLRTNLDSNIRPNSFVFELDRNFILYSPSGTDYYEFPNGAFLSANLPYLSLGSSIYTNISGISGDVQGQINYLSAYVHTISGGSSGTSGSSGSVSGAYLPLSGGNLTGDVFGSSVSLSGNISANSFVKLFGISSQFLKADGSVDSSIYSTTASLNSISGTIQSQLNGLSGNFVKYYPVSSTGNISGLSAQAQSQINFLSAYETSTRNSLENYLSLSGGTLSGALFGTIISARNISGNFYGIYSGITSAQIPDLPYLSTSGGVVSGTSIQFYPYVGNMIVGTDSIGSLIETNLSISGVSSLTNKFNSYLPLSGGSLTGPVSVVSISANKFYETGDSRNSTSSVYLSSNSNNRQTFTTSSNIYLPIASTYLGEYTILNNNSNLCVYDYTSSATIYAGSVLTSSVMIDKSKTITKIISNGVNWYIG